MINTLSQRKKIRLKEYDYSFEGMYSVTVCVQDRECLLGNIVDGVMRLNDAGNMIKYNWDILPQRFPNIELDESVIMPNHIHGMIGIVGAPLVGARYNNRADTRPERAVRRNIERFPEDFMFSLTRQEIMNLSQIVTSSKIKHAPNVFVFTEQGVAMLSGVLNSKRAVRVNIAIMRVFVKLKQILSTHKELAYKLTELENKIEKHDGYIKSIFEAIRELMAPPPEKSKKLIGFGERQDE